MTYVPPEKVLSVVAPSVSAPPPFLTRVITPLPLLLMLAPMVVVLCKIVISKSVVPDPGPAVNVPELMFRVLLGVLNNCPLVIVRVLPIAHVAVAAAVMSRELMVLGALRATKAVGVALEILTFSVAPAPLMSLPATALYSATASGRTPFVS